MREIDICDVLSYELSPISLALCYLNGILRKPNRAALLHELEIENQGVPMNPKTCETDFCDVLSYELSPISLAVCNLNGTLRKPNRAALLHELENQGVLMIPDSSRKMVTVLDIMALIQSITKGRKQCSGS